MTPLYKVLYTLSIMTTFTPISDARAHLPDLVSRVNKNMDRVVITVNGQPKATLVSSLELESLEETAEIVAIPKALARIRKGEKQIKKGKTVRLEDLDK